MEDWRVCVLIYLKYKPNSYCCDIVYVKWCFKWSTIWPANTGKCETAVFAIPLSNWWIIFNHKIWDVSVRSSSALCHLPVDYVLKSSIYIFIFQYYNLNWHCGQLKLSL